jgi:DNA-binding beta-propeller fold protein YncE
VGKILVLDIATGEKIAVLKNDKHPKFDTFGDNIELDIKSGKLIQLARQDLIEVDLQTREVSMTQIEDMNTSNVENASRIAYDNTHIYFTDKENGTVSALNRSTHRLDWTHKLSGKGLSESIQPRYGRILKKKGNRLYVLDNRNTLHVFSKQD